MIAPATPARRNPIPAWHAGFMAMLPLIVRHARVLCRHLTPEAKRDALAEVAANATVAYARLAELGKTDLAFPTPLATYAVAQYWAGRRVGNKLNVRDVLSPYCQKRKKITVERLDKFDNEENAWEEIIVEDRHAGPADTARVRLDFGDWLCTLPTRLRQIAKVLASGENTGAVATRFHVSPGRISQIRQELKLAWQRFVGDEPVPAAA